MRATMQKERENMLIYQFLFGISLLPNFLPDNIRATLINVLTDLWKEKDEIANQIRKKIKSDTNSDKTLSLFHFSSLKYSSGRKALLSRQLCYPKIKINVLHFFVRWEKVNEEVFGE